MAIGWVSLSLFNHKDVLATTMFVVLVSVFALGCSTVSALRHLGISLHVDIEVRLSGAGCGQARESPATRAPHSITNHPRPDSDLVYYWCDNNGPVSVSCTCGGVVEGAVKGLDVGAPAPPTPSTGTTKHKTQPLPLPSHLPVTTATKRLLALWVFLQRAARGRRLPAVPCRHRAAHPLL